MNSADLLLDDECVSKVNLKKVLFYLYNVIKRIFDIFVSLIGIAFTILLMLIVKLINVITGDYDGIFYKQERIGKNGKKFKMYKFRTMVKDADKKLEEVLENPKYRAEWNMNQKLKNDPRITKAGKILRKTSLDEVPQFINVFKGDMSLIGPRPLVEGELDNHNGNHKLYESVRPGITSWWACHGRNNVSYKERLNLEYYYIKNRSLWLDIKCIFLTIRAVIDKTGAK